MRSEQLPELDFYTVPALAKKWDCEIQDVLHYGLTGQLDFSLLSAGWWIEHISVVEDVEERASLPPIKRHSFIPEQCKRSDGELLKLMPSSTRRLLKKGAINDPTFQHNSYDFLQFSSDHHEGDIDITLDDLLIDKATEAAFKQRQTPINLTSYTTPYLNLMQRAIAANNITEDNQPLASVLQDWFQENWDIPDEPHTTNKAKLMTTFIRLTHSGKGGLRSYKKEEKQKL